MSKHTPAPWTVSELDARGEVSEYHIFIEPDVAVIERKVETRNEGRDMANARLIAAAPDLLRALENSAEQMEVAAGVLWSRADGLDNIHRLAANALRNSADKLAFQATNARAAIAKATGSAS